MFVRRPAAALVAATMLTAQLARSLSAQDAVRRTALQDFRVVTVTEGLTGPWGMSFLPNGDLLVTEKGGALRLVRGGKLQTAAIAGVPAVRASGQGGLLDVIPHPQFATNKFIYLSFSKPNADGSQGTTAIVRAKFENDRLTDVKEIFEAKMWSTGRGHYGSRMAFDKDGFLFITLGDRQVPSQGDLEKHPAQDLTTHHGKVVRLKDDGSVPADNPFVNTPGALPEIWSYGHRSVQGIAVHPTTNALWTNEHGPQGGDELNLTQAGKNYGWPVIGFGVNYGSGSAIHSGTTRRGMEQPVNVWVPSIGISTLVIYTGDKYPGWKGNFFVGGMVGQRIVRLTMDGDRATHVENMLQGMGRVRALRQGPDGYLYVMLEEAGKIVRLDPVARK